VTDGSAVPTEAHAAAIFRACMGDDPVHVRRFPTGLAHYVFDVVGKAVNSVVRIAATRQSGAFDSAIYWSGLLRPLGVPLPAILRAGSHDGFAYLVLERLPGTDLAHVYENLSQQQKREIVAAVVRAQARVQDLPAGSGYGYVRSYSDPFPHRTWRDVVAADVARSRSRITKTRVVDVAIADPIERRLGELEPYLMSVAPRPFLDDTTVKNVICDGGRLSGIVDVDQVCFGDPLFGPALTRAALLADGHAPDYVDYWLERLDPGENALAAFHAYTAVFCLGLISEAGKTFNRAAAVPIDGERLRRLQIALKDSLEKASQGPSTAPI
jgi:aminoglycoside phosphotransferase (APT) family kinase protein